MSRIATVITQNEQEFLARWVKAQMEWEGRRSDLLKDTELREESREFLRLFAEALANDSTGGVNSDAWAPVREMLKHLTETRTQKGFNPIEIATFVFSFKQPFFDELRKAAGN